MIHGGSPLYEVKPVWTDEVIGGLKALMTCCSGFVARHGLCEPPEPDFRHLRWHIMGEKSDNRRNAPSQVLKNYHLLLGVLFRFIEEKSLCN